MKIFTSLLLTFYYPKAGVDNIHKVSKIFLIAIVFLLLCSVASAATLKVGSKEKYKTIQSAVNASQNGDTIKVAYGTYDEVVNIDKWDLTILGTKYPKVDGFYFQGGSGTINGFSLQKYGISTNFAGGGTIRNNYFYNCGIYLGGPTGDCTIINNKIFGGTIFLSDTYESVIKGTTVSNSKCGLCIDEMAYLPVVTSCTFKNCDYGVYLLSYDSDPRGYSNLGDSYFNNSATFSNNKYIGNKKNIGWGNESCFNRARY
jgi:nitrous oxidase accessory protein NosD